MIERQHLLIIQAVEETGTLTAAADKLCLTQSALSHSIKKLEYFLKTPVWIKEGRKLYLTLAGRTILGLAKRILPQIEHTELMISHIAQGQKGVLRIGMECHPCYKWLLKIVAPYLEKWSDVEIDVIQKFQFGGVAGLLSYDIDLLVTPDPFMHENLSFNPVFAYEQVLVTSINHAFKKKSYILAEDMNDETLFSYPVPIERLDIYTQFLLPAMVSPKKHKTIETTDIMMQMIVAGRGVAALPKWLALEYAKEMPLHIVSLGQEGIHKHIYLGIRNDDDKVAYIKSFIKIAEEKV